MGVAAAIPGVRTQVPLERLLPLAGGLLETLGRACSKQSCLGRLDGIVRRYERDRDDVKL